VDLLIVALSRLGAGVFLLVAHAARRLPRRAFIAAAIALVACDMALAGGSAVNRLAGADHWQQLSGGARYIIQAQQGETARFYAVASGDEQAMVAGLKYYFPSVYHLFGSGGHSSADALRYVRPARASMVMPPWRSRYGNKGRLTPDNDLHPPWPTRTTNEVVYDTRLRCPSLRGTRL
jgi:hypothetical protein